MLFPKVLKENEYICLFLVKTDKKGNPVLDEDGKVAFEKLKELAWLERVIKGEVITWADGF